MADILEAGTRLGRFHVVRRIGAGGMGVVYLAHDSRLNANVALKVLSPPYSREKFFSRLRREVLLARKVSHPSICRIFDLHEEEGQHFISMEHIEGQTLESYIRENGILPLNLVGRLGLDICRAMTVAHRMKIIHRDLKPGNIMIRSRNRISVLDFGFARELDTESITGAGIAVGTVQYMSPEVLAGKQATQLSDIYSAGVVLYHCVTGRLPFDKSNLLEMMEAIENGKSVPPRKFNSKIPPSLEAIIEKAMASNPKDRYQNFVEFGRSLKNILDDLPTGEGKPVSSPWDGDIEKSVHELLKDSTASVSLRVGVREATILFSDIVSITPYFDKHGDTAGHKKIQTHNEMLFPVIRKHRGKVIKTIGDAIMACFDQADDGVEAAIEMQRAIDKYNSGIHDKEEDERILIRIGLHSGRSVFEKRDVFGNTVNVAARIGSRASGGEILISSFTRELLERNRKAAQFNGVTTLKGKRDVYNLYSVGWMAAPPASSAYNLPSTAMQSLTASYPDLGSEADTEVETDAGGDTGPLPPVATAVDELVDLGSRADVQIESDTAPIEEGLTTRVEPDRPVSREPSWNLVPIDAGEESTTSPPDSAVRTVVAGPAFYTRLFDGSHPRLRLVLAGIAIVVAFGLGVGLTWIFGTSRQDSETGSGVVEPTSPTSATLDRFLSSIAKAHAAAVSNAEEKQEEPEPQISDKEIEDLKKKIHAAMRKKGIILGDSQRLQTEYRKMKRLSKRFRYEEALAAGEYTLTVIKGIRVNKTFVAEKLDRFNENFDKIDDGAADRKTEDITLDIITAIEAGKYYQANRLLNRAFLELESMRKKLPASDGNAKDAPEVTEEPPAPLR